MTERDNDLERRAGERVAELIAAGFSEAAAREIAGMEILGGDVVEEPIAER